MAAGARAAAQAHWCCATRRPWRDRPAAATDRATARRYLKSAVKRAYQDGDGLFLLVSPGGAKSWMLRVQVDGKRRDIGLGTADVDGLGREAFGVGDARYSDAPL
ncbi:MAG: Arm DNA-binding domain-containing protein, partial [Erythrobacteraceae bacterium]